MPLLKVSVDINSKKLMLDHESDSIANGDSDIINRLLKIVASINSFDPVTKITCKRYVPTPQTWDLEIICATGHWDVRYLMDGFDPKIISTLALTDIRSSLVVLMQELRIICTELVLLHNLDDMKFQ